MSDILLKSMHFPSLDARYIVGDDSMSVEGAAADAKATGDALATKADKADTYTKAQVDDKVGDAKTELEEAIDDLEENKLAIDGYSELATVGNAEQLVATQHITDTEPYIYRKTGGPNDVGNRVYDTLVGGSVVWNQLVASGATEVTVPNGHKYYANINGTKSIGASTGTAISINDSAEDNIIDLTAALGSTIADYVYTLETATAGAGVAWFRKYFPGIYYGYCEPHFEHVQVSAKNTVGFNQFDPNGIKAGGAYNQSVGEVVDLNRGGATVSGENPIIVDVTTGWRGVCIISEPLFGGVAYQWMHNISADTPSSLRYSRFYIDKDNVIVTTPSNINGASATGLKTGNTTPSVDGLRYVIYIGSTSTQKITINDACFHSKGDRDGEYEAYRKRTYPLDSSLTLRGIPKLDSANRLYFNGDIYEHDGTVTRRYGIRAYQSGDESLADAITDGTNTVYKLTTPTTETAEPFQYPMVVDPLGTEEFIDYGVAEGTRDVAIPVGHSSEYPADLRGKLQHLPSLASADGRYVVVQTGNQMTLSPDTSLGLIAALEARVAALEGGNG